MYIYCRKDEYVRFNLKSLNAQFRAFLMNGISLKMHFRFHSIGQKNPNGFFRTYEA